MIRVARDDLTGSVRCRGAGAESSHPHEPLPRGSFAVNRARLSTPMARADGRCGRVRGAHLKSARGLWDDGQRIPLRLSDDNVLHKCGWHPRRRAAARRGGSLLEGERALRCIHAKRLCAQQRRCPPLAAAHREAEIEWTATACLSRPSRAGPGEQQQGLVRHSRGGRAHPFERQQQWLSTLYELASWRRRGLRRPPPAPLLPRVSYLCPACGVQATLLRLAPLNRRLSGRCRPRRTGNTPSKAPGRSGE